MVTESEVIERFTAAFPVLVDGRNGTLSHTDQVEEQPVRVERPDWFETAVANG